MNREERTYLPFLDVTRILAVLGVVVIHVVGGGVGAGEAGLGIVALDMAFKCAVPIFFMMSGALSLDPRAHRHGPAEFLRRRMTRVVPALVVWSAFYLVVIRGLVSGSPVGSFAELVDLIITGETYTHLYFLFAIAGLYLITPLLASFLADDEGRRSWIVGLFAASWTVLVTVAGQAGGRGSISMVPVAAGSLTFFLLYTGYFVLGRAVLVKPIPRWAGALGLVTVPGFIALITWLFVASRGAAPTWVAVLAPVYGSLPVVAYSVVLMASVSSLCAGWRVSERTERRLRTLGNATFGIFLVHFAVLVELREVFPVLDVYDVGPMALTWTLTVLLSTVIALIGQRTPLLRRIF